MSAVCARACAMLAATAALGACAAGGGAAAGIGMPRDASAPPGGQRGADYVVDPGWPQTLPNDWIIGQVAGIAVDRRDHVWIVHRPRSITEDEAAAVQNPPTAECCVPAPAVIELDPEGRVVRAWGGPRWDRQAQAWVEPPYDWPVTEHGLFVDDEDNVWIAGNGPDDHIVVKHDAAGEPLLTIGVVAETGGSGDTRRLGQPADIAVDTRAGEVYVADGYGNRRVIVFDAQTGRYLRHWGAYGRPPSDAPLGDYDPGAPPSESFRGPVHAVVLAGGLVYVADRTADRIQVFRPDGRFEAEALVAPRTLAAGSVWDIAAAGSGPDARLVVADGHNKKVWILDRSSLEVVGSFGRGGRQAGEFNWVHNIAVDSRGNVYTAEVNTGKRVQKFVPAGRAE